MEIWAPLGRILSVQSHVVHGVVGNKAAVFPLQAMGFEVDVVNTVSLSNRPDLPNGAAHINADATSEEVKASLMHLSQSGLSAGIETMISGYMRDPSVLGELQAFAKSRKGDMTWVMDPVLGDGGKLYVPPALVHAYREALPLTDCVCPNVFEAKLLAGMIRPKSSSSSGRNDNSNSAFEDNMWSMEGALEAMRRLHELGAPRVLLTGLNLPADEGGLCMLLSDAITGQVRFLI